MEWAPRGLHSPHFLHISLPNTWYIIYLLHPKLISNASTEFFPNKLDLTLNEIIMANAKERLYTIPSRFRKMENMHIVFWLLKDISWCLTWKILAMLMIIPTLVISIVIAWRTRKVQSELAHNLAVSF